MLAMALVLPSRVGRGVMSLSSHAGDGIAEVTLAVVQCHY
jgi:hypothetical protein